MKAVIYTTLSLVILTFVILGMAKVLPKIEAHNTQIEEMK